MAFTQVQNAAGRFVTPNGRATSSKLPIMPIGRMRAISIS
jgi:hypothetical protein